MKYIYNKCVVVLLFVAAAVSACAPDDIDQSNFLWSGEELGLPLLADSWQGAPEEERGGLFLQRSDVLSSDNEELGFPLPIDFWQGAPEEEGGGLFLQELDALSSDNEGLSFLLPTAFWQVAQEEEQDAPPLLLQAPEEDRSLSHAQRSKRVHEDSSYRCDICVHAFKSKYILLKHIRSSKEHRRLLGEGLTQDEQDSRIQKQLEELSVKRVRTQFSCDVCVSSFTTVYNLQDHMKTSKHVVQAAVALYTAGKYDEALVYSEEILRSVQLSHNARLQIGRLVERCNSIVAPQSVASSSSSSSSSLPVIDGLHCGICDRRLRDAFVLDSHKNGDEHKNNVAILALLAQPVTISE
jgi:hypothetical protein